MVLVGRLYHSYVLKMHQLGVRVAVASPACQLQDGGRLRHGGVRVAAAKGPHLRRVLRPLPQHHLPLRAE